MCPINIHILLEGVFSPSSPNGHKNYNSHDITKVASELVKGGLIQLWEPGIREDIIYLLEIFILQVTLGLALLFSSAII